MKARTLLGGLVLVLASAAPVLIAVEAQSGAGQAARPPQQPARDRSAQVERSSGTGSISGRVVTADTGQPVRKARVMLSGDRRSVTDTTDDEGGYQFTDLPPGRYSIAAVKTGFLPGALGQQSPVGSGRAVNLEDGQRLRDGVILLVRGGVITGHVFDEHGEPVVRAQVSASRRSFDAGQRSYQPAGNASTDDRGQYRIFGLRPGTYYISAIAPPDYLPQPPAILATTQNPDGSTRMVSRVMQGGPPAEGYAATYFPSVATPDEASPIALGPGQEAAGIDFSLLSVMVVSIAGSVVVPDGDANRTSVMLFNPVGQGTSGSMSSGVQPDGTFMIRNVAPGKYLLVARRYGEMRQGREGGPPEQLMAVEPITVSGQNIDGVSLVLARGGSLSGIVRLETKNTTERSRGGQQMRVVANPVNPRLGGPSTPATVNSDGTFQLSGLPPVPFLLRPMAGGLQLRGIYANGADISEVPIEVKPGQELSGVEVVMTDAVTGVKGTVTDDEGQPASGAAVLVFPSDPTLWSLPQSRRVRVMSTRPDGQFQMQGLPAGDYLMVAFDGQQVGSEWTDPERLEPLRKVATSVSLEEGEMKTVELTVIVQ